MCSSGACALGCPGGATEAWQQAQPAWEGNTNTAGTYSCMGTLPPGSTPSGQSVMILASGSMTTTGNATFQCLNGAWFKSTATCDGALIDLLTPPVVVCSSGDPVSTMFIDIYATDLYRCADTAGLQFWVNAYTTADGGVPCAASPAASGCWETLILNDTGADYDAGRALGHLTPDIEKLLCMPNAASPPAGYPWSNVATTIEMLGTKCKYLP